jgi:hypothetical protein
MQADGNGKTRLRSIAEKLVELAECGEIHAIKEIADRLDGKPAQTIVGESESPLKMVHCIERVIVRANAISEAE